MHVYLSVMQHAVGWSAFNVKYCYFNEIKFNISTLFSQAKLF